MSAVIFSYLQISGSSSLSAIPTPIETTLQGYSPSRRNQGTRVLHKVFHRPRQILPRLQPSQLLVGRGETKHTSSPSTKIQSSLQSTSRFFLPVRRATALSPAPNPRPAISEAVVGEETARGSLDRAAPVRSLGYSGALRGRSG